MWQIISVDMQRGEIDDNTSNLFLVWIHY